MGNAVITLVEPTRISSFGHRFHFLNYRVRDLPRSFTDSGSGRPSTAKQERTSHPMWYFQPRSIAMIDRQSAMTGAGTEALHRLVFELGEIYEIAGDHGEFTGGRLLLLHQKI